MPNWKNNFILCFRVSRFFFSFLSSHIAHNAVSEWTNSLYLHTIKKTEKKNIKSFEEKKKKNFFVTEN